MKIKNTYTHLYIIILKEVIKVIDFNFFISFIIMCVITICSLQQKPMYTNKLFTDYTYDKENSKNINFHTQDNKAKVYLLHHDYTQSSERNFKNM